MVYNIDFDICALLIYIILLFCFYYRKNIPILQNKVYLLLLWLCLFTTIIDLADAVTTSMGAVVPFWIHYATSYLFYLMLNVLPVVYCYYIITLTDTQSRLRNVAGLLFVVPITVIIIVIVANPFTHWLFSYSDTAVYTRGPALYILYGTASYFLLYGVTYATIYRQIIARNKQLALYAFAVLAAGPIIIQGFFPDILLGMLGISFCMLLIFITIQNSDEIINGRTGLFNRNALLAAAQINFRNKNSFWTLSLHLNNYAYLKRTFGVTLMTHVIQQIAKNLSQMPIKNKSLHYLSNGVFVMLIPEHQMYPELPCRLQELMKQSMGNERMQVGLSAYVCVIHCPQDADNVDALIEYVEYTDKALEHEPAVVYASNLLKTEKNRVAMVERAMETALTAGGFEVYYQAIYSTSANRIRSAEALLRLRDEKLGNIPPDEFIPISERNGSILRIGMMVFRSVCEFISKNDLQSKGIDYIEINLSVAQCMQKKLAAELLETLQEFGLSTDCVNLEITESAAAYSPEMLANNMATLAASGIKFSLDDYGTGFSSMASMVELPFDLVKLDKGIISSMDSERTRIAVRNSIAMLKQLNMGIVAEGVETAEQARVLTEMGCDYLQGYYFSRPVPASDFLNLLCGTASEQS